MDHSYSWASLPPLGQPVEGCHLLPIETPLAAEHGLWGIRELVLAAKVVSLTRLHPKTLGRDWPHCYREEEVRAAELHFGQVLVAPLGHWDSEPYPSEEVVEAFYREVEVVEGLVAVHCTHGVNRTGYLICRYLVEKMKLESGEAIRRFGRARGQPLLRRSLVEHLLARGWEVGEHLLARGWDVGEHLLARGWEVGEHLLARGWEVGGAPPGHGWEVWEHLLARAWEGGKGRKTGQGRTRQGGSKLEVTRRVNAQQKQIREEE